MFLGFAGYVRQGFARAKEAGPSKSLWSWRRNLQCSSIVANCALGRGGQTMCISASRAIFMEGDT